MVALTPQDFSAWLEAYHDHNPGAAFPSLSLLVDADGRTSYDRLIAAVQAPLQNKPGASVIDIGCGDGILLALLGARLPDAHLVGVDQSAGEIEVARATLAPFDAQLMRARAEELPLTDAACDAAVSHMMIMLARDPERALREAGRVLKDGAPFACIIGPVGKAAGLFETIHAAMVELLEHERKSAPFLDSRFFSVEGLTSLRWDEFGFEPPCIETIELSRLLTMDQLISFVHDMYAALMLSAGGKELLERRVLERAWTLADENARVTVSRSVALVSAERAKRTA